MSYEHGESDRNAFLAVATVLMAINQPTLALEWLTEQPVWVQQ